MNRCGQCASWRFVPGMDYDYCKTRDEDVDEEDEACVFFKPRDRL